MLVSHKSLYELCLSDLAYRPQADLEDKNRMIKIGHKDKNF